MVLLRVRKGFYVAIKNGKIIDQDNDYFILLERLKKKFNKLNDIIIDFLPIE